MKKITTIIILVILVVAFLYISKNGTENNIKRELYEVEEAELNIDSEIDELEALDFNTDIENEIEDVQKSEADIDSQINELESLSF